MEDGDARKKELFIIATKIKVHQKRINELQDEAKEIQKLLEGGAVEPGSLNGV